MKILNNMSSSFVFLLNCSGMVSSEVILTVRCSWVQYSKGYSRADDNMTKRFLPTLTLSIVGSSEMHKVTQKRDFKSCPIKNNYMFFYAGFQVSVRWFLIDNKNANKMSH